MEVKIKANNELVDANVEVIDGVMIVSPKEEKIKPKDGDILASPNGREFFFFKRDFNGEYADCYGGFGIKTNELFSECRWNVIRLATEEEKKRFFNKIDELGYEWDTENKELRKKKWKPEPNEEFYYPSWSGLRDGFIAEGGCLLTKKDIEGDYEINKGWCFKSKEACEVLCNKLNEKIKEVEP